MVSSTLSIFSAAALLGVAVFALSASRRTRFAWILAWLCADFAGFTLAQALEAPDHVDAFRLLDLVLSPWAPVLGLSLVLGFTGNLRGDRRWLLLAAFFFGALSLTACLAFIWAPARLFVASDAWPVSYLVGLVPSVTLALGRVLRYRAQVGEQEERRRALGLVIGLAAALPLGASDLLADMGYASPRLSALATLVVALLLGGLTLGADLLEAPRRRVGLWLGLLACGLVLASALSLQHLLPSALAMRATLVLVSSLFALLFAGAWGFARLLARGRDERLRYAGRMSRQLAHDLNTPLMAMQGALDYLMEERRRREVDPDDTEGQMLTLLLEQVERLSLQEARYRRLLQLEPVPGGIVLAEVVERALRACRAGFPGRRLEQRLPGLELPARAGGLRGALREARRAGPRRASELGAGPRVERRAHARDGRLRLARRPPRLTTGAARDLADRLRRRGARHAGRAARSARFPDQAREARACAGGHRSGATRERRRHRSRARERGHAAALRAPRAGRRERRLRAPRGGDGHGQGPGGAPPA
ncbi:MAG: HAMP domain-containing histidine kinase [Deltaproteobacteria bacterium]|nr:HAMP domain-containing histidine kinase [Deltaproteobacteria bacterium]